ncbi:MAG: hypothetical protein IJV37_05665 [Bacteroidales bacterium]|nr:hypothetical protein [Bacteroidales bacterium]
MELKEFVTKTILDIVDGVREAQQNNNTTATINAHSAGTAYRGVYEVEFDVALTAIKKDDKARGLEIYALSIMDFGGSRQKGASNTTEQRVRFKVPISYPLVED